LALERQMLAWQFKNVAPQVTDPRGDAHFA
jgi:hypothetical protein